MKMSKEVLLEIISLFQDGIINNTDISENLREIDVVEIQGELVLSDDYKLHHPRVSDVIDEIQLAES